jgi:hypothetical protein
MTGVFYTRFIQNQELGTDGWTVFRRRIMTAAFRIKEDIRAKEMAGS